MNNTLKSCGDCRWWQPLKEVHLCEQGTCYLNPTEPKPRERLYYCSDFKDIDSDGKELD